MSQEMMQEAVEIVTMSVDKFINVKNYEVRCLSSQLQSVIEKHSSLLYHGRTGLVHGS